MPVVGPDKLIGLQANSNEIRNICILAHVDHGKTSLTDVLIATNGIISPKLAGKIRYLDSRPDEQLRGITMESSAISLYFSMLRRSGPEAEPIQKEYLINLIDSPGHVDFSSEVSTASRLCDGALVLVDAVEGVCSQTVTVLRQTWTEHLKPILVINKIDRLITELRMSPGEAYVHLSKLLEQVNAVIGSFFQGERMEEDLQWRERVGERVAVDTAKEEPNLERQPTKRVDSDSSDNLSTTMANDSFEEKDDEDLYFAPEKNNVIFSSAVDGWAFTVRQFASIYEKKLGIQRAILEKVLWGDFYLEPKTKRLLASKHLRGRALKPMFVQLVLDNIWAVYEATTGGIKGKGDPAMVEKIIKSLSLTIPPHVLRSRDPRIIHTTILAAWLPLSTAVLVSVIEYLPSPSAAQADRLPRLIHESPGAEFVSGDVRDAMVGLKTSHHDPVVAFVSKMVALPRRELPENRRQLGNSLTGEEAREIARRKRAEIARAMENDVSQDSNGLSQMPEFSDKDRAENRNGAPEEPDEEPEVLIGFARLFSGILSVGDYVYVLSPKFTPANPSAVPEPQKVLVKGLYLMMGRGLEKLTSVPAGVVFGIAGLDGHILKSGTLCSQLEGAINLAGINMGSPPIVRVALEPKNPSDLEKLVRGMRLLEQSDPCAQYEVLESGEHVISTAGELHLERCLKDLRERFARCDIQAGEPIVPYRETIVSALEMAPPKNKSVPRGTVIGVTTSRQVTVRLRVVPLPDAVTEFLGNNENTIRALYFKNKTGEKSKSESQKIMETDLDNDDAPHSLAVASETPSMLDFKERLQSILAKDNGQIENCADVVNKIAAFGPRRVGPNLFIDVTRAGTFESSSHQNRQSTLQDGCQSLPENALSPSAFTDKISYAFQLATAQGPLCHEPVQGIAVFLEAVTVEPPSGDEMSTRETLGRLTGEVIKTVRDSIRQGFLDWSPRLLLAMYSCEIQASAEVLGRVYAVITRRRGRIINELLKEGTPFFTVLAVLPIAESFGFSDEIRKRTSGAAAPQLLFHGYEMVLDQDPFWVPFTEDELEDLGELADRENLAKRYMDGVRERKGLEVKGKRVVKDAEKQKTLKR